MHPPNPLHPTMLPPAPGWPIHPAMVTVGFELPGFRLVRSLGLVRGLVVRSPGIGGGIATAFESLAGGNVQTMIAVCERARSDAYLLMLQGAAQLGANAVIGMRYESTEIQNGLTEVLAYGTAIWAEYIPPQTAVAALPASAAAPPAPQAAAPAPPAPPAPPPPVAAPPPPVPEKPPETPPTT